MSEQKYIVVMEIIQLSHDEDDILSADPEPKGYYSIVEYEYILDTIILLQKHMNQLIYDYSTGKSSHRGKQLWDREFDSADSINVIIGKLIKTKNTKFHIDVLFNECYDILNFTLLENTNMRINPLSFSEKLIKIDQHFINQIISNKVKTKNDTKNDECIITGLLFNSDSDYSDSEDNYEAPVIIKKKTIIDITLQDINNIVEKKACKIITQESHIQFLYCKQLRDAVKIIEKYKYKTSKYFKT